MLMSRILNVKEDKIQISMNFIYSGFYIALNTVQVISQWVVLWAEETVHTVRQGSVL